MDKRRGKEKRGRWKKINKNREGERVKEKEEAKRRQYRGEKKEGRGQQTIIMTERKLKKR